MSDLVVLVPVLRRPHRVRPTLQGFAPHRVCFIPNPDDHEEKAAICNEGGEILLEMEGGWAKKLNAAIRVTDEPLILLGADDLLPMPGWFEAAKKHRAGLVGVNDMIRRKRDHTTHFLMTREYAQLPCLDGSPGPVPECYSHSWVDDELIATAKFRGAYVYAPDVRIEHLHPFGGRGTDDATYQKGRADFHRDKRRFLARRHLWEG